MTLLLYCYEISEFDKMDAGAGISGIPLFKKA